MVAKLENNREESENNNLKLKLLEDILKWAKDFSSTDEFKQILKDNSSVIVFHSKWACVGDEKDSTGFWARVRLYKDGRLMYTDGYKWMHVRNSFYFDEETVKSLKHSYLERFNNAINSKEIYEIIKKR